MHLKPCPSRDILTYINQYQRGPVLARENCLYKVLLPAPLRPLLTLSPQTAGDQTWATDGGVRLQVIKLLSHCSTWSRLALQFANWQLAQSGRPSFPCGPEERLPGDGGHQRLDVLQQLLHPQHVLLPQVTAVAGTSQHQNILRNN